MKKVFLVLSLLLSLGMFYACSNEDETVNVYVPIEEGEDYAAIANFFNLELSSDIYSQGFFVDSQNSTNVGEEVCKIINSRKELKDIYSGDKDLPEIDFTKYTLIVGYIIMPDLGNNCVRQELVYTTTNSSPVLNLYVKNENEYKPTVISTLYFWGLYPKMQHSKISVTIHKGL